VEDAVVKRMLGAEARGGVGTDGDGGDLERGPVDRPPEFAGGLGLRDLEAVDLVADGDRADVPGLDVAPDRLDIRALADPHQGDAPAILDPGGTGDDRADDRVECVELVHLQERRARVQPVEPNMGRVEAELLVIGLAVSPWMRVALRSGAIALAVLLFLLSLRRSGERTGRLAERLETTEKANDVQRRMLEAAARRPRDRNELAGRLRDGQF